MGPGPTCAGMLVPIGPVAVFGASNFPLAFSVAGGDTASALAAGCPVVVKAHGSHPATSQLVVRRCSPRPRATAGAPEGTLGIVYGAEAGAGARRAPGDPRGRLHRLARPAAGRCWTSSSARPDPIPFFGELGSLNPSSSRPRPPPSGAERSATGSSARSRSAAGSSAPSPASRSCPPAPRATRSSQRWPTAVRGSRRRSLLNERHRRVLPRGTARLAAAPGVEVVARGRRRRTPPASGGPPLLLATDARAELRRRGHRGVLRPGRGGRPVRRRAGAVRGLDAMPVLADRHRAARAGETELPRRRRAAAPRGRPAHLRRLPDRRRGLVGAAPRRPVAVDELPAHLRRRHRDPPLPAAGHLAGRAAPSCSPQS